MVQLQAFQQVCCRGDQDCQSSFVATHGISLCRVCVLLTAEAPKLTSWAACGRAAPRRARRLPSEAFFAACTQYLLVAASCSQDGQSSAQEVLLPWTWGNTDGLAFGE